jgi:hypothetical protein
MCGTVTKILIDILLLTDMCGSGTRILMDIIVTNIYGLGTILLIDIIVDIWFRDENMIYIIVV